MKYKRRIILIQSLLLSILFNINPVFSSEVTLDQCIEWGIAQNRSLRSVILEQQLDTPATRAAWGQFLPSVSIGYSVDQSNFYNQTYLNPDGTVVTLPITLPGGEVIPVQKGNRRDSRYYLRIEEVIFDGGRNYLNLKTSELTRKMRHGTIRFETSALRAAITRLYCFSVAAEQRLTLASEVVNQRRRQMELAQVRFETGSVTRRDVMQAEVDLGRALSDSLSAVLDAIRTREDMNLVLGLPIDTLFTVAELPPMFEPAWDPDSLAESALNDRSDLHSAKLSIQIEHNDLLASKGDYLPRLTGDLIHTRSEQSGKKVPFTLDPRNRFTSIGLTLSWQLFDRFTRSLRLQDAKIRKQQAIIYNEELGREVYRQVVATSDKLKALYQQGLVADQNRRLAEETLRFEQERYRLGNGTVIELGAAQVSYIQARNDQIRLNTEFYITLGEMEHAAGTVLRIRR